MADYIPARDTEYTVWLSNFVTFLSTQGAALGLTAEQISTMQGLLGSWNASFDSSVAARLTARSAIQEKDADRTGSEQFARVLAMILQNNPDMTDAQRAAAGLTIRGESSPMPESAAQEIDPPLLLLDFSKRRQMTIHWGVNPENERNNGLPEGMRGAKLYFHIGGIPTDESDWQWLADDTRSPFIHSLGNNEPWTVAYRAQWFDRRMHVGVFGDPVVATVSA